MLKSFFPFLQSRAMIAIAISLFFFLGYAIFFGFHYEGLDDFFMAATLSGAYGDGYQVYLTFVNILFGYALRPLYLLCPGVSWYVVVQLGFLIAAFASVSYVLLQRLGKKWGVLLSVIFVFAFCESAYLGFTFTITAFTYIATGVFYFVWALVEKKGLFHLIWGGVLLLLGSWIRYDAFLMGLPFMGLLIAVNFKRLSLKRSVISLVCLGALIVGCHDFDKKAYAVDQELSYYREFSSLRASIVDYQNFDYGAISQDLAKAGIARVDFRSFNAWSFYDPEVYSIEHLRKIQQIVRTHSESQEIKFSEILLNPAIIFATRLGIFWAFFLFAGFLLWGNRRAFFTLLIVFVLALGLYCYFIYLDRVLYRLEYGIWIYATITLLFSLKIPERWTPTLKQTVLILFAFFLVALPFYGSKRNWAISSNDGGRMSLFAPEEKRNYSKLDSFILAHPEKLFLFNYEFYKKYPTYCLMDPITKSMPLGSLKNKVPLGYWNVHFPQINRSLAEQGVVNPMRDAVKENVYVVGELSLEFLELHYYKKVTKALVGDFGTVKVFKYRAK